MQPLINWYFEYQENILISILLVCLYLFFHKLIKPKIKHLVKRDCLKSKTLKDALITIDVLYGIIFFVIVLFIWGFDFKHLFTLATGILALTGVAMFASWSILSNVTAFFIILIQDKFKVGSYLRILDMDNYIEGELVDITLINTRFKTEKNEIIIYPNNQLLAKIIIVNPDEKNKEKYVGKIV